MTINDVTTSLNAMHLANRNEWREKDMEIDHLRAHEVIDEMDMIMTEGERKMYEIYVECLSNDAAEAMEIYLNIMSKVVGSHENAIAVLASNMHEINCFLVNLTRAELEKLVELDNERIRGIYPPYKSI